MSDLNLDELTSAANELNNPEFDAEAMMQSLEVPQELAAQLVANGVPVGGQD